MKLRRTAKAKTAAEQAEDRIVFDKPITLQKQNEETELWEDAQNLHASVNKSGGTESFAASADQFHARLTFKLRYFSGLEQVRDAPQLWRILYFGEQYQIIDYDDYLERRRIVRIVGERYD